MKKLLSAIIFFNCILLYTQNVKVTDYEVPISTAQNLRLDGSWNWSQAGELVTSNSANFTLLYRTFFSSLPLAWFVNVDANGGKSFQDYNHNVKFDISFRKYVWQDLDWFGFTRVIIQHANSYQQVASDLSEGIGFGRYINATALAKAVRIEGHLLKDEIINENFPKSIMIAIANIIERENEYKVIYGGVYEKYWFDDIEREMQKSEILKDEGVGSLGFLRMRQVLFNINEKVNEKYYGWDISSGILFPLTSYDKSQVGNPNLTISGRYSFPINWEMQINSTVEVFTPMDKTAFKQVQIRSGADFIYELSNRVNFVSGYRFGYIKPVQVSSITEHALNASFWYYIENNIYFTINISYSKQGSDPQILSSRVGLQYNLF